MPATVAIILCTRDRIASLRDTLAAIGRCAVPADLTAELIVVDNGSTDGTADLVRSTRLPNLPVRYVPEPAPGQVRARNAGLRASAGAAVVLFTDDDVRPVPDWIEGMCRPILAGAGDAVTGTVTFPPHHAAMLAREPFHSLRGWFAATDHIDPAAPGLLVGANMAFSRRVVETLGGFDPELGPGALGFYDDTVWSFRIQRAGFRLVAAAPGVSVEHHFDRSRLTRGTLLSMAGRMGRSEAWLSYHWEGSPATVPAAKLRRARGLLGLYRTLTPWRLLQRAAPAWELRRVQTLAYLEELGRMDGQPRKYPVGVPASYSHFQNG